MTRKISSSFCCILFFQFVAAYFQQFLVSLLHEVLYAHEFTFYIYTRVTFLVVHLQLFAQTAPFDDVDGGEDDKLVPWEYCRVQASTSSVVWRFTSCPLIGE